MREVKEGRLPQTALGGLTADKLRAVEEVLQIESTLDNVKQSLMKLDTMRRDLNDSNDLVEVEALSEHHNCPVSMEHLGLSDNKLQSCLTRKLAQLHYYSLLASIKQFQNISSSTKNHLLAKMCELKAAGTGYWMKALPTSPRFSIPRDEFRTVVATHMLLPTYALMGLLGLRSELMKGCLCNLGQDKILTEDLTHFLLFPFFFFFFF